MGDKAWRVRLVSSVILAAVCIGGRRPALAENSQAAPKAAEFFVSLQGNDAWSGRVAEPAENDGPFATVARAKQAVRELRRAQTEPVRVVLSGGTYFLAEPLDFWPSDSGTQEAPITYAAAPGEKVILSGGFKVTSDWSSHTEKIMKTFHSSGTPIGMADRMPKWKQTITNAAIAVGQPP